MILLESVADGIILPTNLSYISELTDTPILC